MRLIVNARHASAAETCGKRWRVCLMLVRCLCSMLISSFHCCVDSIHPPRRCSRHPQRPVPSDVTFPLMLFLWHRPEGSVASVPARSLFSESPPPSPAGGGFGTVARQGAAGGGRGPPARAAGGRDFGGGSNSGTGGSLLEDISCHYAWLMEF